MLSAVILGTMARRKQSPLESMLYLPWWINAGLGVVLAILAYVLPGGLASGPGPISGLEMGLGSLVPLLILAFFSGLALLSAFFAQRRNELIQRASKIEGLRALSWSAFEIMVAEAYRRQGYAVDQSLEGGPDGGVDLTLRKDGATTIVQCKHWRNQSVGAPVVRELFGVQTAERAQRAIVITSGGFTREAEAFAQGKPIELINGPQLLVMLRGLQDPKEAPPAMLPPICPKCGTPMVTRVAKRGANAGSSFWGCPTYPKCTGTRST